MSTLFQDALGRPIDAAARAHDGFLLSSGLTANALALAVLTSPEGETHLVENLYEQFLHRPADPAGLNSFIHELAQGTRDELIIASILASDEYLSRAI